MSYTKTTWVDNQPPYINAENLNKIENQLEINTSDIATNTSAIETNTSNIATNTNAIGDLTELKTTEKNSLVGAVNEVKTGLQYIHNTIIKTITTANDAVELITLTQLRNLFNAPSAVATDFYVVVNNGDGSAFGKHFENCTWVGNTLHLVWDGTATGSIRINYIIFYVP